VATSSTELPLKYRRLTGGEGGGNGGLAMKLAHGPLRVMWYVQVGDSLTEALTLVAPGTAMNLM